MHASGARRFADIGRDHPADSALPELPPSWQTATSRRYKRSSTILSNKETHPGKSTRSGRYPGSFSTIDRSVFDRRHRLYKAFSGLHRVIRWCGRRRRDGTSVVLSGAVRHQRKKACDRKLQLLRQTPKIWLASRKLHIFAQNSTFAEGTQRVDEQINVQKGVPIRCLTPQTRRTAVDGDDKRNKWKRHPERDGG